VREDPGRDPYLESLLRRVDRALVISGIGERPAVVHLREWKLPGFTTGSGCIAPRLTNQLYEACARGDFAGAESLRNEFIPLEDLRDAFGPAPVLHAAVELAGIAQAGEAPPFVSAVSADHLNQILPAARDLLDRNAALVSEPGAIATGSHR
jgi:dihydrodipicolinate synthase/N-acetylneuraminate lyase